MRILFMGTPDFAVPSLARLIDDGHEIVGVLTQPDKPQGRQNEAHPAAGQGCSRRNMAYRFISRKR